jgi:hypothetical protein
LAKLPQDVVDACAQFRQGDLIPEPPIVEVVDLAHPLGELAEKAAAEAEAEGDDLDIEFIENTRVNYGIIVSQTCDIRSDVRRTVKLAPVYPLKDPDDPALTSPRRKQKRRHAIETIADGRKVHQVLLDGPAGYWYADLEMITTAEKSVLLDKQRVAGFSEATGYRDFSFRCGHVHDRPAVPEPADRVPLEELRQFLLALRESDPEMFQRLRETLAEEMLLLDDWDNPTRAQIWFLGDDPPPQDVRDCLDDWLQGLQPPAGLSLLQHEYRAFHEVSAAEYRDLVLIGYWYLSLDEETP